MLCSLGLSLKTLFRDEFNDLYHKYIRLVRNETNPLQNNLPLNKIFTLIFNWCRLILMIQIYRYFLVSDLPIDWCEARNKINALLILPIIIFTANKLHINYNNIIEKISFAINIITITEKSVYNISNDCEVQQIQSVLGFDNTYDNRIQ